VIVACGVLHNLAIENGDRWEDIDDFYEEFEEPVLASGPRSTDDALSKLYRDRIAERIYAD